MSCFLDPVYDAILTWQTGLCLVTVFCVTALIRALVESAPFWPVRRPHARVGLGPYRSAPVALPAEYGPGSTWRNLVRPFIPIVFGVGLAVFGRGSLVPPSVGASLGWTVFYGLACGLFVGRSFRLTDEERGT